MKSEQYFLLDVSRYVREKCIQLVKVSKSSFNKQTSWILAECNESGWWGNLSRKPWRTVKMKFVGQQDIKEITREEAVAILLHSKGRKII